MQSAALSRRNEIASERQGSGSATYRPSTAFESLVILKATDEWKSKSICRLSFDSEQSMMLWLLLLYFSSICTAVLPLNENDDIGSFLTALGKRDSEPVGSLPEARVHGQDGEDTPVSRPPGVYSRLAIARAPRNLPGTNDDVPGLTPKPATSFGLTEDDPSNLRSDLLVIRSQPAARHEKCTGALPYESCLGGDHGFTTKGIFLPTSRKLLTSHVSQGEIGDCAFGAAVKSMILTGFQYNLSKNFRYSGRFTTPGWENTIVLMAKFYKEHNAVTHVIIDDGLPKPCESDYLGFYPSGPDNVAFVPLLEKAFAKFVDAFPQLYRAPSQRATNERPETWGYNGLTGVSGGKVLRALRGGTVRSAFRQKAKARSGKEKTTQYVDYFNRCVRDNIPCVAATPKLRVIDPVSGKTTSINLDPFPMARRYLNASNKAMGGQKAKLYGAWTIENVPVVPSKRPGVLFRLRNPDDRLDFTLVEHHAYSLSRGSTKGALLISNPWNCSPDPRDGKCDNGTGEVTIPTKLAAAIFSVIEWVD